MRSSYVKKTSSRKWNIIFVIIFVFVFYYWSNIRPVLYRSIEPLAVMVINFSNKIGSSSNFFAYFKNKSELNSQLEKVTKELEVAQNKNNLLTSEIDRIASKLAIIRQGRIDSLEALAIGDIDGEVYKSILLNKGFRDGVQVGAVVYTSNMSVVGKVVEVFNKTSKVELLSKDGSAINAILESTGEVVKLTGVGSGAYIGYLENSDTQSNRYKFLEDTILHDENYTTSSNIETATNTDVVANNLESVAVEQDATNSTDAEKEILNKIKTMASSTRVLYAEDSDLIVGDIVEMKKIIDEDKTKIVVRGDYDPSRLEMFYISK